MDTVINNNQTCFNNETLSSVLLENAEEYLGNDKKKARMLADKIKSFLSGLKSKAESMLENTEDLEAFLERAEKKLKKLPGYGAKFVYIPQLTLLLISYAKGEYRDINKAEIIFIVVTLLYVLLQIDVLPDFIPGAGLLDDAALMVMMFNLANDDIEAYMQWRERKRV